MMTATIETVSEPATCLADLSADVDALAALQAQISRTERMTRQLRARVREAMNRAGIDAFVSAGGHRASLFEVARLDADRALAERILPADLFQAIWSSTRSMQLRVR